LGLASGLRKWSKETFPLSPPFLPLSPSLMFDVDEIKPAVLVKTKPCNVFFSTV
jgi:hypothetical protein